MEAKKVSDAFFDTLVSQFHELMLSSMLKDVRESKPYESLSSEDKARVNKLTTGFYESLFKEVKEEIKKQVGTAENLELIAIPAYNKYFTEAEIKELVAFYQSSIGKKFVGVQPVLMNEISGSYAAVVAPQAERIVRTIVDERLADFQKQLGAILNSPSSPRRKNSSMRRKR